MAKNETFTEKVKVGSRKVFIGMGNMAAGNPFNESVKKANMDIMPFSWAFIFPYETPIPKRRNK